jgi:hypothetical protein
MTFIMVQTADTVVSTPVRRLVRTGEGESVDEPPGRMKGPPIPERGSLSKTGKLTLRRALRFLYAAVGVDALIKRSGPLREVRRRESSEKIDAILSSCEYSAHRVVTSLKRASFECRKASLESVSPIPASSFYGRILPRFFSRRIKKRQNWRHLLMQISMLGRALPQPPVMVVEKSMSTYLDIVTAPAVESSQDSLLAVVKFITKGGLHLIPLLGPIKATSPGACFENSRSKGGFTAFVRNSILDKIDPKVALSYLSFLDLEGEGIAKASLFVRPPGGEVGKIVAQSGSSKRRRDVRPLLPPSGGTAKLVVVPEYGYKARIVQSLPAADVAEGHQIRDHFMRYLTKYPPFRQGLGPDDVITFKNGKFRSTDPVRICYSMDLSNATDTINRDVLEWAFLFLKIPRSSIWVDKILVKETKKVYSTTTGTCMGASCSWVVLSTIHLAVCYEVDRLGRFVIRGDDLAAYWTDAQFSLYVSLMSGLGFRVNLSKSFVSKDSAIFCERLYHMSNVDSQIVLTRDRSILSIRQFSRPPTSLCPDRHGGRTLQLGNQLDSVSFLNCSLPYNTRRDISELVFRYSTLPWKVRRVASMPLQAGGLGFHLCDKEVSLHTLKWLDRAVSGLSTPRRVDFSFFSEGTHLDLVSRFSTDSRWVFGPMTRAQHRQWLMLQLVSKRTKIAEFILDGHKSLCRKARGLSPILKDLGRFEKQISRHQLRVFSVDNCPLISEVSDIIARGCEVPLIKGEESGMLSRQKLAFWLAQNYTVL